MIRIPKYFNTHKSIELLSLFNGLGGAKIALDNMRMPVNKYYSSEVDKYAAAIDKLIHPDVIELGDINKHQDWEKANIDLLVAGFPCQAFSIAGKRKGLDDSRGDLVHRMFEVIWDYQPRMFLLENVRGLLSQNKGETIEYILEKLRACGYNVDYTITNSALLSAQNRVRVYFIGVRNDIYKGQSLQPPQPNDKYIYLKDIIEYGVVDREKSHAILSSIGRTTLREYFKKHQGQMVGMIKNLGQYKVHADKANCLDANYFKGVDNHGQRTMIAIQQRPRGNNQGGLKALDGKVPCVGASSWEDNNHLCVVNLVERRTEEGKRLRAAHRKSTGKDYNPFREKELVVREDGKVNCLQTSLTKNHIIGCFHIGNAIDIKGQDHQKRVYLNEGKSPTVNTMSGGNRHIKVAVTDIYYRKLTPRECGRLQTIPEEIIDKMVSSGTSNTQLYKMVGNGFTCDVVEYYLKYMFRTFGV